MDEKQHYLDLNHIENNTQISLFVDCAKLPGSLGSCYLGTRSKVPHMWTGSPPLTRDEEDGSIQFSLQFCPRLHSQKEIKKLLIQNTIRENKQQYTCDKNITKVEK
jgi:hypothetical protein